MKMTYERPKMKVEQFQANSYVNSCGAPVLHDWLWVKYQGVQRWFFGNWAIDSLNQNTKNPQYYYKEVARVEENGVYKPVDITSGDIYYLEYSDPYHEFVLYKEGGADTGYYEGVGDYNYYTRRYEDYEKITSFDGSTTLQVNNGSRSDDPDFAQPSKMIYSSTQYLDNDGNRANADAWHADQCLGVINKNDVSQYEVINS